MRKQKQLIRKCIGNCVIILAEMYVLNMAIMPTLMMMVATIPAKREHELQTLYKK